MQTILCGLIVVVALVYVANRWLPSKMRQKLFPWQAARSLKIQSGTGSTQASCSSCSSCGGCGSAPTKVMQK